MGMLQGVRVLVVEDDYAIASEIAAELAGRGAHVVGPTPDAARARTVTETEAIDFALLDIHLDGHPDFGMARLLAEKRIPFAFATGHEGAIPAEFGDVIRIPKPFRPADLASVVAQWRGSPSAPVVALPSGSGTGLLGRLEPATLAVLRPHMMRVSLDPVRPLLQRGEPIRAAIFPESGICSLVVPGRVKRTEVAMIGREGMVGLSVVWLGRESAFDVMVSVAGTGIAIAAEALASTAETCPDLSALMTRYAHALGLQIAYSAKAHAELTIERRLARWILMAADRVGERIPITHEALAAAFSVRRAGITRALHVIEGERAIRSDRGLLVIRDRERLLDMADDVYGAPEQAYERLIGR